MNVPAIHAMYRFQVARLFRSRVQLLVWPVVSTAMYFAIFGAALGERVGDVEGIDYGAFIVPGLVLYSILSESVASAASGIYMQKWQGSLFEVLAAPVGWLEVLVGYVGAAMTKSLIIATLILLTARCFVAFDVAHPIWILAFLILITLSFCLFGFILGIWADAFEKLQMAPMIIMPLTFLGGTFYSITMLPEFWQKVALFNPVVYLVSGLRWSLYGHADVRMGICLGVIVGFLAVCLGVVSWIFRTGWRLKN